MSAEYHGGFCVAWPPPPAWLFAQGASPPWWNDVTAQNRIRRRVVPGGTRLLNCLRAGKSHTYLTTWGNDERLSLDKWIGLCGLGFLALLAAFVAVSRISGVVIAGVQPEAWALTAMMTAPFTVGAVSLFTLVTALTETMLRRRRPVGV